MSSTLQLVEGVQTDESLLASIHTHSLDLLGNCGIRFHSEKARKILQEAGAQVSGETVKIPAPLVESALKKAPHEFTLFSRDGKHDLPLDGRHTYYSQDGCAAQG